MCEALKPSVSASSAFQVIGVNEHGVDCDEEPEPDPTRNVVFNINVSFVLTRGQNVISLSFFQFSIFLFSFLKLAYN